jgi:hypothetical protein
MSGGEPGRLLEFLLGSNQTTACHEIQLASDQSAVHRTGTL